MVMALSEEISHKTSLLVKLLKFLVDNFTMKQFFNPPMVFMISPISLFIVVTKYVSYICIYIRVKQIWVNGPVRKIISNGSRPILNILKN